MKRLIKLTAVALLGTMGVSCTTSYDSYGNQRQAVDPAGAAIGAVALGALAYSIGKNRGERNERRRQPVYHHYDNHRWNQGWQQQQHWGRQQWDPYCR